MILYVNGCSHTAAAEAVVPDVFAVDDGRHGIDRRPHPINLEASWGRHLSRMLNTEFYCENTRDSAIIRVSFANSSDCFHA